MSAVSTVSATENPIAAPPRDININHHYNDIECTYREDVLSPEEALLIPSFKSNMEAWYCPDIFIQSLS